MSNTIPLEDPVLALIAEHDRLDRLATPIRARADKMWFATRGDASVSLASARSDAAAYAATGKEALEGEGTPSAPFYREAEAIEAQRDRLFGQVTVTKATTIEGIIAQVSFLFDTSPAAHVTIVIAGLRSLMT